MGMTPEKNVKNLIDHLEMMAETTQAGKSTDFYAFYEGKGGGGRCSQDIRCKLNGRRKKAYGYEEE